VIALRRQWQLVVAGVVIVGGCWALTTWFSVPVSLAVASLVVAILTLLVTAASFGLAWLQRREVDGDRVTRDLARAVRVERQRFLDQALAVAWQARPAKVVFHDPDGDLPEPVETLLLQWQDPTTGEVGSIEDAAAFYNGLPSGRLVVLGAPGAGKTVLLSRLVLDLLDRNEAGDRETDGQRSGVPVLLSLPSCDLGDTHDTSDDQLAARLQTWIVRRLVEDYGLRPSQAAKLVQDRRILPVLDGLDEMDSTPPTPTTETAAMSRPRARAVVRAMNAAGRPAVVLACRHQDYREINQPTTEQPGDVAVLTDARHVMLRPLDADAVIGYLTDRFHGRDQQLRPRWRPIADALTSGAPLARILANPWQLYLAVTAYTPENSDPADLLDLSPDDVESHLLTALIPAVVDHDATATGHGWTADRVTHWLTTIAEHQAHVATEHGSSPTDIHLPDLWRIAGRRHPQCHFF